MAERSLKVLDSNRTFFGKLSNTFSKLLVPTKIGINGIVITLKRNNLLKSYENYMKLKDEPDSEKKNAANDKYEEAYTLYLEAIDKHIMDTVYKKVRNNTASDFEKDAMGQYYTITALKNTDYVEYRFKKQKYLIELDYESLKVADKTKQINKYKGFYLSKMDVFYKGILKNYSVHLAESSKKAELNKNKTFYEIFKLLEEYMTRILPLTIEEKQDIYEKIKKDYDLVETLSVGKLTDKDELEKKLALLNISRVIFTHSLPLVAAEKCYEKLIEDSRYSIVNGQNDKRKEEVYILLLDILEEYNGKLLSGKIYWEDLNEKEKFKKFWEKFEKAKTDKEKEIYLLKREVSVIDTKDNEMMQDLIKYYKDKLLKYGAIRQIKNSCKTATKFNRVREGI